MNKSRFFHLFLVNILWLSVPVCRAMEGNGEAIVQHSWKDITLGEVVESVSNHPKATLACSLIGGLLGYEFFKRYTKECELESINDVFNGEVLGALEGLYAKKAEGKIVPIMEQCRNGQLAEKCFLFHGEPGAGKAFLAKFIATKCGATLIERSCVSLGDDTQGRTVAENLQAFEQEIAAAPKNEQVIILLKSIDYLAYPLQRYEHSAIRELIEFLNNLRENQPVLVIGTTDRAAEIDGNLKNQVMRLVEIGLPALEERENVLKYIYSHKKWKLCEYQIVEADYQSEVGIFSRVAKITEGFSRADLRKMLQKALYAAENEEVEIVEGNRVITLRYSHFEKPIIRFKDSKLDYENARKKARKNKSQRVKSQTADRIASVLGISGLCLVLISVFIK